MFDGESIRRKLVMTKEKRVLQLYLIFVLAISAVVQAVWIYSGDTGSPVSQLLMVIPMAVAFVLKLIFYKKQNPLRFRAGKPLYYLLAVIIPLCYIGLGYILYWLFVPGTFAGTDVLIEAVTNTMGIPNLPLAIVIVFSLSILLSMIGSLGEEAGWRGLMYPIMHGLWGRNKALIVSGLIWAVWHIPLMIGGVYNLGAPLWYGIPMFIIQVLALTVVVSWLSIKSNSVWPAAIWHTMQNFLNQFVFRSMTTIENSVYFIDETGIISTVSVVLFAVFILVFGKFDKQIYVNK
jgi:membrane protease YdiL (CAAX protease family)